MIPPPQPEYFLISKDEINFMRTSMFSDRGECRKIMQTVLTRPHSNHLSERDKVLDKFLKEIRVEMSPPFEYLDWDSIEAVYIKLRQQGKEE